MNDALPHRQYDPFGEPLERADAARPGPAARATVRLGVGLFWSLVVAIVAARAVYFDPDLTGRIGSGVVALAGEVGQHLRALVAA